MKTQTLRILSLPNHSARSIIKSSSIAVGDGLDPFTISRTHQGHVVLITRFDISLATRDFRPSRDQRQTLNRWNRYVLGQRYANELSRKHPKSKSEKKNNRTEFDLVKVVHEAEQTQIPIDMKPDHCFEVTIEPDVFTEEKYALFCNYQQHVHHETKSELHPGGFQAFLCSSTLHRHEDPDGKKLGSYHQCYRLDGRLIAMAVLDLLPHAVSAVYFIYHQDFEKWSFGKLSALREAALALEGGYSSYYMGYYIHSCRKMRYKSDYKPQHVLDIHSFEWNVLDDDLKRLMEHRKYASISMEKNRQASAATVTATAEQSEREGMHIDDNVSNCDNGSDPTVPMHPNPIDAMESPLSLINLGMPGVISREKLESAIDLDKMKVLIGRGDLHQMQDLVTWEAGNIDEAWNMKGFIAQYAACVGPLIAEQTIVDLRRR